MLNWGKKGPKPTGHLLFQSPYPAKGDQLATGLLRRDMATGGASAVVSCRNFFGTLPDFGFFVILSC